MFSSKKLRKSLVFQALNIPFQGADEEYSCMRFAQEACKDCVAVVREVSSFREYRSSKAKCAQLAKMAIERGARLLLCEYDLDGFEVVHVDNAFNAWMLVTAAYRRQFNPKTVCVTGSIGKTSTTAMTKAVFSSAFRTLCNTGNTNSPNYSSRMAQQLTADTQAYVQEAMEDPFGTPGVVSQMVLPQAAIVTVIGSSHLVSLGNQETILKSCLSIQEGMPEDGLLILNGDDPMQWNAKVDRKAVYYAVKNDKADYRAENIRESDGCIRFDILYGKKRVSAELHCFGLHNVGNAVAAFAAGKWAGMTDEQIVKGLASFRPEGIRQNLVEHGGYRLFMDCYNAAPESMRSALTAFAMLKPAEGGKHIAVLADIMESGNKEEELHRELGRFTATSCVDTLICFGENARLIYEGAKECGMQDVYHTQDEQELDRLLSRLITRKDVALFKGSRAMMLEKHVDNVFGTWFYERDDAAIGKSRLVSDGKFRYRTYPDHAKVIAKETSETAVEIPAYVEGVPVTGIEQDTFANSRSYTVSVVFPDTLKNIREKAFYTVSRLESIRTPSSLLTIASRAFQSCRGLKSADIAEGCISIGAYAFADCGKLGRVRIPESVHQIGEDAFKNSSGVVIECPEGSYAEQYAKKNGIRCTACSSAVSQPPAAAPVQPARSYSGSRDYKKYKKEDIDYEHTIRRPASGSGLRCYQEKDGVWELTGSNNSGSAVILCGGDLMCEPAMSEASFFGGEYDFKPCFKFLRPALEKADLVLANLETIVSERIPYAHEKHRVNHHTGVRYHCNAPESYLDALKYAGFDGLVLANNHDADGGYDGLIDTLENIDARGFMRTGMFKNEKERRVLRVDVNGIRLAVLSYTQHINRNLDSEILTADGCETLLNRFSEKKLRADISQARAEGAEFILVYVHFLGKEYSHEVINGQRTLAKLIAEAGADCIMGSHMHAIQEFDRIVTSDQREVPVMYSLGNLVSSDGTADLIARRSVMYRLTLKKEDNRVVIAGESYIPLRVVEGVRGSSYVVFPTLPVFRKNAPSNFFEEAQKTIEKEIGQKIAPATEEELASFGVRASAPVQPANSTPASAPVKAAAAQSTVLEITGLTKETAGNGRIRAAFHLKRGSNTEKLWFEFDKEFEPDFCDDRCDAAVVSMLLPAMKVGYTSIRTELPISEKLFYNLTYQVIPQLCAMGGKTLSRIRIEAPITDKAFHGSRVACGMSRGVDSFATMYEYCKDFPIDAYKVNTFTYFQAGAHHGWDATLGQSDESKQDLYEREMQKTREFCKKYGYPLIVVDSNLDAVLSDKNWFREWSFDRTHTTRNLAMAQLFQKGMSKYYYSSAYVLTEFLPRVDSDMAHYERWLIPLLSTDSIEMYQSNQDWTRMQKVEKISQLPESYDYLHVCLLHSNSCGVCAKCKRTLMELDSLGDDVLERYRNCFDLDAYRKNNREKWFSTLAVDKDKNTAEAHFYDEIFVSAAEHHRELLGDFLKEKNPKIKSVVIPYDGVNIRALPSLRSEIYFASKKGDTFEYLGEVGIWVGIRTASGQEAYVVKKYSELRS